MIKKKLRSALIKSIFVLCSKSLFSAAVQREWDCDKMRSRILQLVDLLPNALRSKSALNHYNIVWLLLYFLLQVITWALQSSWPCHLQLNPAGNRRCATPARWNRQQSLIRFPSSCLTWSPPKPGLPKAPCWWRRVRFHPFPLADSQSRSRSLWWGQTPVSRVDQVGRSCGSHQQTKTTQARDIKREEKMIMFMLKLSSLNPYKT